MRSFLVAASFFALFAGCAVAQDEDPQQPTKDIGSDTTLRTPKALGCYSHPGEMWDMGPYTYQTPGWCQPLCVRQGAEYFALVNGTNCFCGNDKPESDSKVEDGDCNVSCNGYDKKMCGGTNKWMIFDNQYRMGDKTGTVKITTPTQTWYGHDATDTASSTASSKKAKITGDKDSQDEQSTVLVTISGKPVQTLSTSSPDADSDGGPNKAGIAAGVVVGVVALAGIIGGVIFFLRRKKQKELDDERRRHEAMTSFVTRGEKPPSTFSASDSRLEPSVMFQRRQSDGSIADNQDYSRRILKVTNPDDR